MVADFGCGEAVIAQRVTNEVHSFDLVAKNKFVTACNMAKVGCNQKTEGLVGAMFLRSVGIHICFGLMPYHICDCLSLAFKPQQ